MANKAAAIKYLRQSQKRRMRNKPVRTFARSSVRDALDAIDDAVDSEEWTDADSAIPAGGQRARPGGSARRDSRQHGGAAQVAAAEAVPHIAKPRRGAASSQPTSRACAHAVARAAPGRTSRNRPPHASSDLRPTR